MPNRQAVQPLPLILPLRHELIHQRNKTCVMRRLDKMHHLMHEYVFEAVFRLLGKFSIKPDRVCARITASPFGFHLPDKNAFHVHANQWCPARNYFGRGCLELLPIPPRNHSLFLRRVHCSAHREHHARMRQDNRRGMIALDGATVKKVIVVPDRLVNLVA